MTTIRGTTSMVTMLALLAFGAGEVAAHGEATLRSSSASVAAGGAITLSGAGFAPGQAHRLLLRSTLEDYELRSVTATADSTFTVEVPIPAQLRSGQYRIVAVAPDGDEVATLDLPVLTAATPQSAGGHAEGAEHEDASGEGNAAPGPEARADEIVIERSRAGVEWAFLGLVIGLAGGLGVGLLRKG